MTSLLVLLVLAAPTKGTPPPRASTSTASLPHRAAVFAVPKDEAARATAAQVEVDLSAALEAAGVSVTSLESLFTAPERENVGAKRIKEGEEAFENLDLEAAAKKYEDALGWYTQHPEFADAKQLADIHLFLASVALGQGKAGQRKAREDMERALVFFPSSTLDPKYFGPDAKKLWEKAKSEVERRPTAKLTIESTPAAEATFQGAVVKEAPTVPVGRHLVTFKRPGYQNAGVLVDVFKDGGTARAKLEPVGDFALVRTQVEAVVPASFGALKAPPGAKTIGTAVKSRFLVLASMGSAAGELEVWDAETSNVLKDVTLGTDAAAMKTTAAAVKNFIDHPSVLTPTNAAARVDTSVEPTGNQPVFKKWWFWAIVGGVVVAGATTTGVVVATSGNGPRHYNPVLDMP